MPRNHNESLKKEKATGAWRSQVLADLHLESQQGPRSIRRRVTAEAPPIVRLRHPLLEQTMTTFRLAERDGNENGRLFQGSGTDVSHYFVRFFAVVSEVFCLKKCCVFFVLLLCVLDSFCN